MRFGILRLHAAFTFLAVIMSLLSLSPTAEAVDVKVPPPPITDIEGGVPPQDMRLPVVIHILAPSWRTRGDEPVDAHSFIDAGRLFLAQDYTITYFPGKIDIPTIASWVENYNNSLLSPYSPERNFKKGFYTIQIPGDGWYRAPAKSWNAFLLIIASFIQYELIGDSFAVTYGEAPTPDYVPQYEMQPGDGSAPGNGQPPYKVLNSLPGMRIMNYCDFRPSVIQWCQNPKMRKTPE